MRGEISALPPQKKNDCTIEKVRFINYIVVIQHISCLNKKETNMRKLIVILVLLSAISGCIPTRDLARSLRYPNNDPVGVENIKFVELDTMKKGKACTVNLLYVIPLFGDGSIIKAAEKGKVNNVELIGETGWWYFPFCTVCTVVYGDKSAIKERPEKTPQEDNSTIKEKS
jgi:hypothetical protein